MKRFLKVIMYYYLALLIFMASMLMWLSIILIPIYFALKANFYWWDDPFNYALTISMRI